MAKWNVTEAQVFATLRGGAVSEAAWENGSWRHQVRAFAWLTAVVAFEEDNSDDVDSTVVVTVIDRR